VSVTRSAATAVGMWLEELCKPLPAFKAFFYFIGMEINELLEKLQSDQTTKN